MHSQLLARNKLRAKLPEYLAELEILRLSRNLHAAGELEVLAGDGVSEGALQQSSVLDPADGIEGSIWTNLVLDFRTVLFRGQQVRDLAALGADGCRADLGRLALGDAVEGVRELVLGILANLLTAIWVVVVECFGSAQSFDELVLTSVFRLDEF